MRSIHGRKCFRRTADALALCGFVGFALPAEAAELGVGNYLLGLVFPLSGYTPPPGLYYRNTFFLYRGTFLTGTDRSNETTYHFVADINILAWYPDFEIFGAAPGFAATIPYIGVSNTINAMVRGSDGTTNALAISESANGICDTEYTALLGWHAGEHHWNVSVTAFTPTGNFIPGKLGITGLNRPALDIKGAYTFLRLETGFEASAMLGMTINARNTATDYQSGAEMHFEWALHQHLPIGVYAGVTGFIYQQVTDDTGTGAIYGPYRGRVFAIGPSLGYTFAANGQEIKLSSRWYHEFGAQNHPQGDAIFASLTFRL